MEKLKVLFLMGPADCNDPNIPAYSDKFLADLSAECGFEVVNAPLEEVAAQQLPVFFIASGGAENGFKAAHTAVKAPYILLTTPSYNSLAAAMEIMGFLDENGLAGEILHGSIKRIAARLKTLYRAAQAVEKLKGMRLGCVGKPGGLIASDADPDKLKAACGMEIVDIDLQELVAEYHKGGYTENQYTQELKSKKFSAEEIEKALNVYGGCQRLIEKYKLDAITVRCFELINYVPTTGCLALAILNTEGIPAACEGDAKTLVAMSVLNAITGGSSFMANPSCMDPDTAEIIFAHCTLPIDMPDDYFLTTHFETNMGVAVACDIAPQRMTLFKCNDDLSRWYADGADLMETLHRPDLCRSQMRLHLDHGTAYFENGPISNHHLICKGDWSNEIAEFFKMVQIKK